MPHDTPDDTAKRLCAIFGTLETERYQVESLWRDVSKLVMPSRSTEDYSNRGRDRTQNTYDNTATVAATRLASLMSGSLTSPALEWFVLQPLDPSVRTRAASLWLEVAQQTLLSIFRSSSSGFNSAINEAYMDLVSFGTCAIFTSGEDLIRFNALSLRELYIAQNYNGLIDTVVRKKMWTADQAAGFFGKDNLSTPAKEDYASEKRYTLEREYLHFVLPAEDVKDDEKISLGTDMRFASVYVDKAEAKVVRSGGFKSFPYSVGRWKVSSGEIYGTSPATDVMDEIRMAQAIKKTIIVSKSKQADPPLVVDDDTVIGKLRATPGGITYRQPGKTIDQLPIGDASGSKDEQFETRAFIEKAFFNDIAQLPDNDRMTATEVAERRNDRLGALAPFTTRVQEEVLGHLISRTLEMAVTRGVIEEPPEELVQDGIHVEYVSPLAVSQRSSRVQAVQIWVNALLPFVQMDPSVGMAINVEEMPGYLAEALNVPPQLLRPAEEVAELKAQAQQLAQLQAEAQAGREVAETAKTAAEAGEVAGRIGIG